jgi:hypothetical protein
MLTPKHIANARCADNNNAKQTQHSLINLFETEGAAPMPRQHIYILSNSMRNTIKLITDRRT